MKLHTRMLAAVAAVGLSAAALAGCGSSTDTDNSSGDSGNSSSSDDGSSSGDSAGDDSAGDDSSDGALAGQEITLGMVIPLTGPYADFGPYLQNGAQLAVDEINANGGVLGATLKLEAQDGACDAKSAATAANKLVADEIAVSVGGYCSGATLPTLPIFDGAGVPMVIPAANSDELVEQKLPMVFLINGTGTQQAQAALKFIDKQGAKNVAIVDDNTSYSVNIADLTEQKLADDESGAQLAIHATVTAGENDYGAAVTSILDTDPDFVYYTGYYQEAGLIVKQLRNAGYEGDIMVGDGSVDKSLIEIAGKDNAQGVYATMTQTPATIPGSADWIAKYTDAFGEAPGPYSTQSYDAVRVAAKGIEDAGSTDGAAISSALEALDGFKLFSGPLKFTDQHTLSNGGFLILKVEGDGFVVADQLQD